MLAAALNLNARPLLERFSQARVPIDDEQARGSKAASLKIDQNAAPMAGRFIRRNPQRDKNLRAVLCDTKYSKNGNRHDAASQADFQMNRVEVKDRILLLGEIPYIPGLE